MAHLKKCRAKDVIALAALILVAIMKLKGLNGSLDTALALILGYYFAHRFHGQDDGK